MPSIEQKVAPKKRAGQTKKKRTEETEITYRYSDADLKEFKTLIEKRKESAQKELQYFQSLIQQTEVSSTERGMANEPVEKEDIAQLASRQIQFIKHLDNALIRIENKTYGICRVTGKLIDKKRLLAVPHATLSIEAKKMQSN